MKQLIQAMRVGTGDHLRMIKRIFDYMDEDGNQTISRDELKKGLEDMGYIIPANAADALHMKLDVRCVGEQAEHSHIEPAVGIFVSN